MSDVTYTLSAVIEDNATGEVRLWQASTLASDEIPDAVDKIDEMISHDRGTLVHLVVAINYSHALEVR